MYMGSLPDCIYLWKTCIRGSQEENVRFQKPVLECCELSEPMLGTNLRSFGKAASALYSWIISPTPTEWFFFLNETYASNLHSNLKVILIVEYKDI